MSEKLTKDAIDLSTLSIPRLFGRYFLPTLLGMLSISAMTAIDGIFVGHTGIWLALAVSEMLTTACIIGYMTIRTS